MMDAMTAPPQPALRWTVAATLGLVGVFIIRSIFTPSPVLTLQTLALLAVALATYVWVLFPAAAGAGASVVMLGILGWAWAVHPAPALALSAGALAILTGAAAVQRARRARHLHALQQAVDDLGEDLALKEQAVAGAVQTRDALQRKLARYTQLQTIAEELSGLTQVEPVAALAVDRAFSLIGKSEVCLLFLVDAERQELSLTASKRRSPSASIRAKHGDQFDRHVLRTHRPLLVNDVRRDFRFTVAVSSERDIASVIACPLMLGERPSGVLRLDSAQPAAYNQEDLRFLDTLLDLVSTAMTNARLFKQAQQLAVTDGLTGLSLRRPFMDQLTRELARASRSREPVSVLMIDVDHFKSYNDSHGHTAGDLVLKDVADTLRATVPAGGVPARYGGEEFVVLLPRTGRLKAADVAEAVRRAVEQRTAGLGGAGARAGDRRRGRAVTVSVGVAAFPDDGLSELELIRVADQRLYEAKKNGRNMVCSA
jgi:diguanylate cyclase (GGDEF)-like protein